ncbi:MAG: hypothetical protein RMI32_07565 [Candidatus Nitrosocaldus sp.]|nr:hypothetical protein [Candidatus Nitrosocaldus sp.]
MNSEEDKKWVRRRARKIAYYTLRLVVLLLKSIAVLMTLLVILGERGLKRLS